MRAGRRKTKKNQALIPFFAFKGYPIFRDIFLATLCLQKIFSAPSFHLLVLMLIVVGRAGSTYPDLPGQLERWVPPRNPHFHRPQQPRR
jgi:hypothetical protein